MRLQRGTSPPLRNPQLSEWDGRKETRCSFEKATKDKRITIRLSPEQYESITDHAEKNTHEALISQEIWDIVQAVRSHKRRPSKRMEESNLFSGLVYCSDCGKSMVFCRTEKMKPGQYYFRCYTYGKRGKAECSPHRIKEIELKAIVLDDLRRVTHFARLKEQQFAEFINQKNTQELRREMNAVQKDLDTKRKRSAELSSLFKRLYEDNVLGRITNEQFRMLSADYNAEQKALEDAIPKKEERLEKLTPEVLRLFVQRIEIGERSVKYSRSATQEVKIIYNDIGAMDSPMQQGEERPKISPKTTNFTELKSAV